MGARVDAGANFGPATLCRRWVLASNASFAGCKGAGPSCFDVRGKFCVIGRTGRETTLNVSRKAAQKRSSCD